MATSGLDGASSGADAGLVESKETLRCARRTPAWFYSGSPASFLHGPLTMAVWGNYHRYWMSHTLLLALLPVGLGAAGGARSEQALPSALQTRLQRIEAAFRDGDAGALRRSFAASGKMRVDLKGFTEGQEAYGAGQLQVIFGQIFDAFRTRAFSFAPEEVSVSSPGTAFARGRWTRAGRREHVELVETLTFTLRGDGSDWRILEIRSSR